MSNDGGICTVKSSHALSGRSNGIPIAVTMNLRDIQAYGNRIFKMDHWRLIEMRFYREMKEMEGEQRPFLAVEAKLESF